MKRFLFCLFAALAFAACTEEGLFEDSDGDNMDENKVYSDPALTRKVVTDLYGRMRETTKSNCGSFSRFFDMTTTCCLLDNATDDGAGNLGRIVKGVQRHLNAAISATTNPVVGTNPWTWYYRAIRSANIFLSRVDDSPLDEEEKASLKKQVRFLRALYYHELFRWFGALVITEQKDDPFAFEDTKRETAEYTVKWIVGEFTDLAGEEADGGLPESYESPSDYGRATRGAAMAYKARTLLYAASPLHAATTGVTWAQAAQAARDLIDYADSKGVYELYDDGTALSYRHLFVTRYADNKLKSVNKEMILTYMRANANDLYNNFPSFNPWNQNKETTTTATQWLIDSYDMKDGQEPVVGYLNPTTPIINEASGYNDQKPYANRDPRLDQTFLHDGTKWPKVNKKAATADISTPDNWRTGYFLCKFLDERIDHRANGKTSMNFPMMRYAEVLLNYAEAINEAENSADARTKAVAELNRIRKRAGITKDLVASDYDQNTLRERIRKERRVELCFEEHRFYDIKRWMIASTVMKLPATGITKVGGKYVRTSLDSRSYNERMNLMPIPKSEVYNCPQIWQNPGY